MNRYQAFELECSRAVAAENMADWPTAEMHWSRAHILGQPRVGPHLRTHLALARMYLRQNRFGDAFGQWLRFALVVPGTLLHRLPAGNTGLSNVSAFKPMPVPEDLARLIAGNERENADV